MLRIAAVQLDYTPNTESSNNKRWFPDEPLIDWRQTNQAAEARFSVRSGPIDAHQPTRHRTQSVIKQFRRYRQEQLDRKLKQILEFCVRRDVDIAVLPEALVPAALVPVLVHGFRSRLAVFAGLGTLRPEDARTLQELGFENAAEEIGRNAAVYVDANTIELVTKRDRATNEVMERGSGTARVEFRKGRFTRDVGLAVCRDYVNAPRTFDTEVPTPDLVLVSALTKPTEDFIRTPRNFAVAFANHSVQGGSAVLAPQLQGFFLDMERRGTDPLPPGESIVVVDYEKFGETPTQTIEPGNRLVHRAALVYDDPSPTDPGGSRSSLTRQLADLTLTGLNFGDYDELLSVAEARLQGMSPQTPVLLSAVEELRRNAGTLSSQLDLDLFTGHVILTDVKSEAELQYEVLGKLLREWHHLIDPDSNPDLPEGISLYYERGRTLRSRLSAQIRTAHRDSPLVTRENEGRASDGATAASAEEENDGFSLFYSVRLGSYGSDNAVRSLEQQLGALRTLSAADDDTVRLIYQTHTARQTKGHLAPFFDVIGMTESTEADTLEDLGEGVGQQLATAFRSTWDVSAGPENGTLEADTVVELRLRPEAVPWIREDWSTLVDYLRTLRVPVTVQMTCRRLGKGDGEEEREPSPAEAVLNAFATAAHHAEPTGFFSAYERDAAAFLERAAREEADERRNLTLLVHVGSADALPDSVLWAIGNWLFRSMPFDIVRGDEAREPLAPGAAPENAPRMTPSEILRIFHPPYGRMESRGLDTRREASVPVPAPALPTEGLLLGTARTEGTREDRWLDVRLDRIARLRHTYVLGPTGSGKTNLLKNLARQDIMDGHGLVVIDPHGDLVDYLVRHTRTRDGEVLLLDFGDPEYLPVLNPLDLDVQSANERNLAIERFIGLMVRQSHHTFYGPRFESMIRLVLASATHAVYPIRPASVLDVGTILRNNEVKSWVQYLLRDVPGLRERWETFDKQSGSDFAELLDWALSKFSEMEQDGTLRHVLASGESTVSLSRFVHNGGVVLVKIPEWEMSASSAALLGGFIQEHIRQTVYRRWRQPEGTSKPFFMYVDEFQAFSLGGFEDIVAEARKFGLGLVLAHQNLYQLNSFSRFTGSSSEQLISAILGNVANRIVFGLSHRDAAELAKDFDVDVKRLLNPGLHRATAQVLLGQQQRTFTLAMTDADSDTGLPDQYDHIRRQMIEKGYWRRREDLRAQDEARARKLKLEVRLWQKARRRQASQQPGKVPPQSREMPREEPLTPWPSEGAPGTDHVHAWEQVLRRWLQRERTPPGNDEPRKDGRPDDHP
ncbi:type IV secretion system DNA-binding domain-containing protein [Streptomyces sp. NBC_00820]|uniref:type IV secretory system conjugative DNA transfer family protein n=1 Tax=Streptomyces sp. NBC_00820 TaxID=2975842 RepID=UPI002ED1405D|nr:type IV secretion system DNA-binding domain-containing protein [Streptomyces sp. NBC_00820]